MSTKFVDAQVAAETADPINFEPDLDQLAAFRLLVHAEIEHFLEEKARENIDSIAAHLATNSRWMRQAPELLAVAIALDKSLPKSENLEGTRFNTFISEIVSSARKAISKNNGVKEAAFLLLSICAGKTLDEVDDVLSASLNSYGKSRGDVAHTSVTHTRSIQAPSTEATTARELVRQLGVYFDVHA